MAQIKHKAEKNFSETQICFILFACFFVLAITISKAVIYFDKNFLLFPSFWISDVFNLYFNLLSQSASVMVCPKCNQNFENGKVFGDTFIIFVMLGYLDLRTTAVPDVDIDRERVSSWNAEKFNRDIIYLPQILNPPVDIFRSELQVFNDYLNWFSKIANFIFNIAFIFAMIRSILNFSTAAWNSPEMACLNDRNWKTIKNIIFKLILFCYRLVCFHSIFWTGRMGN